MMRRNRKREGVSPVIATILMVAITVVLAAVLYVLVSGFFGITEPPRNIGVACVKIAGTANNRCEITSADSGTTWSKVSVQVLSSSGELLGSWSSPVGLGAGGNQTVSAAAPPLSATSQIRDNGDAAFGIGDTIFLNAVAGASLSGVLLKLSGGGDGSTTVP